MYGQVEQPSTDFNRYFKKAGSPVHSFREGEFDQLGKQFGVDLSGYNQDITSLQNVWKGKAKAADYGDITGATIAAILSDGNPEAMKAGRAIGRTVFPAIGKLFKSIF